MFSTHFWNVEILYVRHSAPIFWLALARSFVPIYLPLSIHSNMIWLPLTYAIEWLWNVSELLVSQWIKRKDSTSQGNKEFTNIPSSSFQHSIPSFRSVFLRLPTWFAWNRIFLVNILQVVQAKDTGTTGWRGKRSPCLHLKGTFFSSISITTVYKYKRHFRPVAFIKSDKGGLTFDKEYEPET